ncbi:hypothetical protein GIB67_020886 [Kingdonia uniflora]|uniref:RNase H type-1 domain-containing protein n=1 Tax=Kingdonia uniflora TaxID=39325 RepID=A0A7J7M7F6_9MAGN|nr:hypothetical protein GIB67_020886 [Kingdonia uniflora]
MGTNRRGKEKENPRNNIVLDTNLMQTSAVPTDDFFMKKGAQICSRSAQFTGFLSSSKSYGSVLGELLELEAVDRSYQKLEKLKLIKMLLQLAIQAWEAVNIGLTMAAGMGREIAWVEADSVAAVLAFQKNVVPWSIRANWRVTKKKFKQFRFSSIWREANFSSDKLSKKGCHLAKGIKEIYVGMPPCLFVIEDPLKEYFRFD